VRSLATRIVAARGLPGSRRLARVEALRSAPTMGRSNLGWRARKAGGKVIPPLSGPMTTGAPTSNRAEGVRGDTGVGWCTTEISRRGTSSFTICRWVKAVRRWSIMPEVPIAIRSGRLELMRQSSRWTAVSRTK
jgi:hypothetical protein